MRIRACTGIRRDEKAKEYIQSQGLFPAILSRSAWIKGRHNDLQRMNNLSVIPPPPFLLFSFVLSSRSRRSNLPALRVNPPPESAAINISSWAKTENPCLNKNLDRGPVSYDKPSTQDSVLKMPRFISHKALPT